MYTALYEYLLLYRELRLPGIGTIVLERKPATGDFPNRLIHAPAYSYRFAAGDQRPVASFYSRLAGILRAGVSETARRFDQFCEELQGRLAAGDELQWDRVGLLKKGLGGEYKLVASVPAGIPEPVPAEKVLREKAAHWVKVGEEEKTSEEMSALLNQAAATRNYWWIAPLALLVLGLAFIVWQFVQQGGDPLVFGNQVPLGTAGGTP